MQEVLTEALRLLTEGGWSGEHQAADLHGSPVPTMSEDALMFSSGAAILRAVGGSSTMRFRKCLILIQDEAFLDSGVLRSVPKWNDAVGEEAVKRVFASAIERLNTAKRKETDDTLGH